MSEISSWKRPDALWRLARESVTAWIDDFAPSMGAAISYYTVFSIAPLLLIVIGIAGMVFGTDAASGRIYAELQGLLGSDGAAAVQGMVKSASRPHASALGTGIGVVLLLLGATTVFAELESALDRIWRAPATKLDGLFAVVRARLISFGLVLAVGFLLLVSLVVSAGLAALGSWWAPMFGAWEVALQVANFVVSLLIVIVLFAAIYKWLPRASIAWRDVWVGAAVTGILFTVGKLLIGLYIGKSGVASGFGAAGSLVVLLIWVYYSAQIFLLGAEFTWLFAYRFGSRRGAAPVTRADRAPKVAGSVVSSTAAQAGAAPGSVVAKAYAPENSGVPPAQWLEIARAALLVMQIILLMTKALTKRREAESRTGPSGLE